MRYQYIAKSKENEPQQGIVDAADKKSAREILLARDITIISLKPAKGKSLTERFEFLAGTVPKAEILAFVKHLSIMIRAGLPLRESIKTIHEQSDTPRFKNILKDVIYRLNNGETLASGLSRHPAIFNELFVNMVKIGESSGTLEENLVYLAEQLEKSHELRRKVVGASVYPIFILSATFLLGILLTMFVLPRIIPMFERMDVELPVTTRVLINVTNFMEVYGLYVLIGAVVLIFGLFLVSKIRSVKIVLHNILLHLPIVGKISRNTNLAYMSRTMGLLLKSGVPVLAALHITGMTSRNLIFQKKLLSTEEHVRKGMTISDYLEQEQKLFTLTVSRITRVGERTGKLEETMEYLADFYEGEVDATVKNLSNILEPVLLVVIGFVVGFIAVSIIHPIYQISGSLGR